MYREEVRRGPTICTALPWYYAVTVVEELVEAYEYNNNLDWPLRVGFPSRTRVPDPSLGGSV